MGHLSGLRFRRSRSPAEAGAAPLLALRVLLLGGTLTLCYTFYLVTPQLQELVCATFGVPSSAQLAAEKEELLRQLAGQREELLRMRQIIQQLQQGGGWVHWGRRLGQALLEHLLLQQGLPRYLGVPVDR